MIKSIIILSEINLKYFIDFSNPVPASHKKQYTIYYDNKICKLYEKTRGNLTFANTLLHKVFKRKYEK